MMKTTICENENCTESAITRSINPDWSKYELCAECAAEFDGRPHGIINAEQDH